MWCLPLLVLALSVLLCSPLVGNRQEPVASRPDSRQAEGEIVLTELRGAAYPRLARNAAIQGKVELKLRFKGDGTLESVDVVRADPTLFVEAVIGSARASRFECAHCVAVPDYSLTYEFQIVASDPEQYCKTPDEQTPPKLDPSLHKVTVFANEVWTCDLSSVIRRTPTRVRSAKCLYLWKCGLRLESSDASSFDY
jgi:hypothetical protein